MSEKHEEQIDSCQAALPSFSFCLHDILHHYDNHFQIAYAETAGKRKEDKHKDELHSLQQQIQSKEREIQSTQKLIVQALVTLVSDAEECAKYTFGLNTLLHKLGKFCFGGGLFLNNTDFARGLSIPS